MTYAKLNTTTMSESANDTPGAPAAVTDSSRRTFTADVCELLPNSLLLKRLPKDLGFRERISVQLFGCVVSGEVVFSSNREAAVVFQTTPEIFEAIEAFEDFVHQAPSPFEGPDAETAPAATIDVSDGDLSSWDTLPSVDGRGLLAARNDLDKLGMLISLRAGRPLLVRSAADLGRVRIEGLDGISLAAVPIGRQGFLLIPPGRTQALDLAIRRLRSALDALDGKDRSDSTVQLEDLPHFLPDGTIVFQSLEQFSNQLKLNLINGAIMAKGPALSLGTKIPLVLSVPNREFLSVTEASVMFADDGTLGFSVADTEAFKMDCHRMLKGARKRRSSSLRSSSDASQTLRPVFRYNADLTATDIAGIINLRRTPNEGPAGGKGWYVGVLDRVLQSGTDAVLTVTAGDECRRTWLYDRRVVAVECQPSQPKDRLGERLVSARILDNRGLEDALSRAAKTRRPLGQVILASGTVTRAALHRALRKQIMDRVIAPCDWTLGRIEVGPWIDPPIDADLLPVNGDAVTTALLRKQLQQTRLSELKEGLLPVLNRPARVELSRIVETYRLTERELRFFQRGAEADGSLAMLISLGKARPLEGYRLALMGAGLGFIQLNDVA